MIGGLVNTGACLRLRSNPGGTDTGGKSRRAGCGSPEKRTSSRRYIIDSGGAPFFGEAFFLVDWVPVDFFDEDFFFAADFPVLCTGFTSSFFLQPVTVRPAVTRTARTKIRIFFMDPPLSAINQNFNQKILLKLPQNHCPVNKTKDYTDPGHKKCYNKINLEKERSGAWSLPSQAR
jgi:hypothetical protein